MARFPDEFGKAIKDLELSIGSVRRGRQSDTDGDGVGDVCDMRPNDPTHFRRARVPLLQTEPQI